MSQTDITLRHGDSELVRTTLPVGQYVIGRNPDVQIYVDTPLLSRRHARLTIDPNFLLIEDLGSRNGTFIDNEPVAKVTRFQPNQALRLGDVLLEIRRRNVDGARPAPKLHAVAPPHTPRPSTSPTAPPSKPASSPTRKSRAPFYLVLLVLLGAVGGAGFYFWPRPETMTAAEAYARAHSKAAPASQTGAANISLPERPSSTEAEALMEKLRNALRAARVQGLSDSAVVLSQSGMISVDLRNSSLSDVSILKGYPVDELQLSGSKVTNLDPLPGLPLATLHFNNTGVTDARPVAEISTLQDVLLGKSLTNPETLRTATHIRRLSYDSTHDGTRIVPDLTAAEFWKKYDEQQPKRAPAIAALQKMGVKTVTEQRLAINKAGKLEINISGQPVSDLAPLSGLPIARLDIGATKVSDLVPLHGMSLQYLNIRACPVTDLSPVHGQPINELIIGVKDWKKPAEGKTRVSDISAIRGMPLRKISLDGTLNPDLTPLADCPTVQIVVLPSGASHVEALRKLPNLKKISWGYPGSDDKLTTAAAFWKTYDARSGTPPPAVASKSNEAPVPGPQIGNPDDNKALADARQKRSDLLAKFQFADAHDAILAPSLQTEGARNEQEMLGKKAQWLANFKSQLIEDLNKSGYAQPVAAKSGAPLPGGIVQADDRQLVLKTARGPIPVPWTEISPDSIVAMGSSFIEPNMPKEIAAFRKWQLGVFASFAGKKEEGLALLREAAQLKPVYKDELPVFEHPIASW